MRLLSLTAVAASAAVLLAALPAAAQTGGAATVGASTTAEPDAFSAQTRRTRRAAPRRSARPSNSRRTRVTVRRGRSFLDPGTEVLPLSQPYTDYAMPPLYAPTRIWDTTGAYRSPLPGGPPNTGWIP